MAILQHVKHVVIGAGVHGLSTAYRLALALKARGRGDGRDILVIDKTGIAAAGRDLRRVHALQERRVGEVPRHRHRKWDIETYLDCLP